jgi:hypothetical protein
MISILLSLLLAAHPSKAQSLDSLVTVLSKVDLRGLRQEASTSKDLGKAVVEFFIAIQDTSSRIAGARTVFGDARVGEASAVRTALLGASEAISAREAGGNRLDASRWIGNALRDLDDAVSKDSASPTIRVIRINALARVPEMFRVDARIAADRTVLLAHVGKDLDHADGSILLALGTAAFRARDSVDAARFWNAVAARGATEKFLSTQAAIRLKELKK